MFSESKKRMQIILGDLRASNKPLKIFDKKVVDFLNEVSIEIIKNKKNLKYSDLITFGFWCRKANINKQSSFYDEHLLTIGRGKVLHITRTDLNHVGVLRNHANIVLAHNFGDKLQAILMRRFAQPFQRRIPATSKRIRGCPRLIRTTS